MNRPAEDIVSPRLGRLYLAAIVVAVAVGGICLSLMRDARQDETIYLRDVAVMAECLRAGQWFGNEAVGLHGFLFKLPAALLFLITGRSVFVATLVTVAAACGVCVLAYRFLLRVVKSRAWAIAGTWMLAANFQFVRLTPTFTRDIPALLAVLLFVNAVMDRRNRWTIGFLLLLILDAKEYLFFMLLPSTTVWILVDEAMLRARKTVGQYVASAGARLLAALLPATAWLVLMFCTGVVPLNMFAARVLQLTEGGRADTATAQFNPALATRNLWKEEAPAGDVESAASIHAGPSEPAAGFLSVARVATTATAYARKLLYPSVFSFDGIPQPVALPALAMSVLLFCRWFRLRDTRRMFLCLLLWTYLAVYLAMDSYPRYMLPVFPILITCFLEFLRGGIGSRRFAFGVLGAALVFTGIGLCFSGGSLPKKIVVNGGLLVVMAGAVHAAGRGTSRMKNLGLAVPAVTGGLCLLAALLNTWRHPMGQVRNYRSFGYNRECERVMAQFGPQDRIWVNDAGWRHLNDFYRGEFPSNPEWEGKLKAWVPKKILLRRHTLRKTSDFWWWTLEEFRVRAKEAGIEKVGLVVSHIPDRPFAYQEFREAFDTLAWLRMERETELQNKTLRIYRVVSTDDVHGNAEN